MRFPRFLPTALILPLLIGLAAADQPATIYLQWNQKLIPQLKDGVWRTQSASLNQALQKYSLRQLRPAIRQSLGSDPYGLGRVLQVDLENANNLQAMLLELRQLPGTVYAVERPERQTDDFKGTPLERQADNVPTDPLYSEQWFYPVMSAPAAWDLTRGVGSVVVAIVDNGTDWNHPDLSGSIWSNPEETSGNNLDDDQNGFVDDIRGWDFVESDNNPEPEPADDYHGTHTAGLVGAMMNNGRGVVGMAPLCKVMPVRCGYGDYITNGLEGIVYAAYNGADIISLSWGGSNANSFEQDVINDALLQGCLIVAAAGNAGNTAPHYPAAYNGVMAVASTNPDDNLSSFSSRGDWVTVCAPGQQILSLIPDGYGTAYGTSMSTPLAAGVAALVKSYHPSWNGQQLFNQLRYTTDDITAKYPIWDGLVGTGRINAFRALAETAPGIQVAGLNFIEIGGDGDNKLDPGEQASLILSLLNTGQTTSNIHVVLTSPGPEIQVEQGVWDFVELFSGATVNNSAVPFQIRVQPGAGINQAYSLNFTVSAEAFYSADLNASLWVDPAFADHDIGNVTFTITDFGAFGYQNYTHDEHYGSGFRFPKTGSNALYHGSFMAGTSTFRVSDCAYGSSFAPHRFDWTALPNGELKIYPGLQADQEGLALFQDTLRPPAIEQVGLVVTQRSYAYADTADADYVILTFSAKNVSGSSLQDLYLALYMDWDLINFDQNEANWDSNLLLGYVNNSEPLAPNNRYYGTSILAGPAASYRVIDNYIYNPDQMTDSLKYVFMTSGFVYTASPAPTDLATMLTVGPFTLAVDDTAYAAFAVLGGWNLADLQASAAAAQTKFSSITASVSPVQQPTRSEFCIREIYPRPTNGAFRISFALPGSGQVKFDLVDILGRVAPIWSGFCSAAGTYTASISDWQGASGIYFLRGSSPYGQSLTKIVWLK